MGVADWYKDGDYNQISDRSGKKMKASWSRKEWTGATVLKSEWEPRHPQDLIRAIPDKQDVPDPNPEGADVFLAVGDVVASDL